MRKELRYKIRGDHDGTGLRKMRQDTDRSVNHVKTRFAGLATSLRAGLAGGLAGGLLVGAGNPFNATAEAIEKLDGIAKRARTSGLTAGFYQTISVAANEASINQGLLDSSLIAFVKRMGELQGGTGPLATSLAKIDGELASMLKNTTSQEHALRIVADRMATYDNATREGAVSAALFSRAGVVVGRVLRQGSKVFDETGRKAQNMGLIIKDDLLTRAEELQNEYGLANDVLDLQFKATLVELAPTMITVAKAAGAMAKEVRKLTSDGKKAEGVFGGDWLTNLNDWLKNHGPLAKGGGLSGSIGRSINNALVGTGRFVDPKIFEHAGNDFPDIPIRSNVPVPRNRPAGLVPQGSASSPAGLSGVVPRIKPVRKEAAGLTSDLKLLNDDFDVTIEKTTSWTDTLEQGLSGIGSGLVGVVRGTQSLNDLLDSTIDRMASLAADQLFNSLIGGLFGSVGGGPTNIVPSGFAGFFANGGNIPAGQVGIAGERGPEMITGPATVTPMRQVSGGGNSAPVFHVAIDARGAERGTADDIVRKIRPELERLAVKAVAHQKKLNPAF